MTIFRAAWFLEFQRFTARVASAHPNLTGIADLLRDANREVWSIVPNTGTSGENPGGLEGWRDGYAAERQAMIDFLATNRTRATTESAIVVTGMDGFITSIANLGSAFNTARATYLDGNGDVIIKQIPQPDRDILATAIENELEA